MVGPRRRSGHRPRRAARRCRTTRRPASSRPRPAIKGGAELAPYLDARGRFFPGGHCPTVGIGGFLLQGGQGWNARGWGWAAEYVEAVDVVTAAGELVRASADENADLYWAARGAGPGFPGVVTRFHLRTLPAPGALRADRAGLPPRRLRRGDDLAARDAPLGRGHRRDRRAHQDRPDDRPDPILLVTGVALVDGPAEADAALAPFRTNPALDRALLVLDAIPTTLDEQRKRQLEDNPEGHRWAVDNAWLSGSAAEVVPAMRRAYTTLPNDKAFTIWFSMAPLRTLPDMAFSLQSEIYLASYVAWESPADDERCIVLARGRDGRPRAGHRRPVPRRQRPLPPPGAVHVRRGLGAASRRSAPTRDPDGLFVGYLAGPDGATNRNHWE